MHHYGELFSYLPNNSRLLLIIAFLLLAGALFVLFRFPGSRANYVLLFLTTVVFGTGFATMDPFLHPWDEQFHALVARNFIAHPLKPVLLEGNCAVLNYRMWINNRIWLHKQPLFLWQMALSIKLFGANVLAVRIPSIFLHALTTLLVFSIGKRHLHFYFAVLATVLFGCSGLLNDYTSGAMGMDHNDVAFVFYVTASFWSWMKYSESRSLKWVVLIGLFAGGAVLCKWLTGLTVFAGWGFLILIYERGNRVAWKDLFRACAVTLIVAAPWQLYCWLAFPEEFRYEMAYNSRHLFHALEQHAGDSWFYFNGMKAIYGGGELMRLLVLAGLLTAWYLGFRQRNRQLVFAAFSFTLVYVFFSVAATKLEGYVLIVSCYGFIFLLLPFDRLFSYLRTRKQVKAPWWSLSILTLVILVLQFNPKGVTDRHYYKSPAVVNAWMHDLDVAVPLIRGDRAHRCFLIRHASGVVVPVLRFLTGKEIYAEHDSIVCSGCRVIDLQASAPPRISAN